MRLLPLLVSLTLLQAGAAASGCVLDDKRAANPEEHNEALFEQGLCFEEASQFAEAKEAFEAILATQETPRLNFELGKTYLQLGLGQEGLQQFQRALDSNPPPEVQDLIAAEVARVGLVPESVLTGLHTASGLAGSGWHGDMRIGRIYDSNVNSGPVSDTVMLFGLPFQLNSDAKPRSDMGTKYAGHLSYRVLSETSGFDISGGAEGTVFDNASDWNRNTFNLDATKFWTHQNTLGGISVSTSADLLDQEVLRRMTMGSVLGKWQPKSWNGSLLLGGTVSGGRVLYGGTSAYAATRTSLTLESVYQPSGTGKVFGQVVLAKEDAESDLNTFTEAGVTMGAEKSWTANLGFKEASKVTVDVTDSVTRRKYQGYNVLFDATREDTVHRVSGAIEVSLPVGAVLVSLTSETSRSTISLYQTKHQVVGLEWHVPF
ncbi:uncharacterized protein NMK_2046 [Novimethylophilus kurashikiensis]|uniref:Tetratricopeptide repeat protein n=2 Tax=Novimethylophilus kurashikiensis TaxID=1825523 RepID=A0A2R5F8C4_9PROT|nr:uncharacterized protein NMK_2046 [Novimethylophilus kurashikiensis]